MESGVTKLFIELVQRQGRGDTLSPAELALLELGLSDPDCLDALNRHMEMELYSVESEDKSDPSISSIQSKDALAALMKKIEPTSISSAKDPQMDVQIDAHPHKPEQIIGRNDHKIFWRKWMAVAAVLLFGCAITTIWWQLNNKQPATQQLATNSEQYERVQPIVPGSSGAILTLGNGRKIALGSHHTGLLHIGSLTIQPGKDAAKLTNLEVAKSGEEVLYNTLTTPRGRQYQIELPDGTKVWLNASSSLKFPTIFNPQHRTVELSGEAYFEVVHNSSHPFQVKVKDQLIEDIGTKFNVKAYSDEPTVRTALVEGIIDVTNGIKKLRMKPGQGLKASANAMSIYNADLNQVLAWKSGFFAFQKAGVDEIMRQLSRWYDVDVVYSSSFHKTKGNDASFTGSIDRNLDLQDVLDGLQFSQVHFKIDKNKRTIIIEN